KLFIFQAMPQDERIRPTDFCSRWPDGTYVHSQRSPLHALADFLSGRTQMADPAHEQELQELALQKRIAENEKLDLLARQKSTADLPSFTEEDLQKEARSAIQDFYFKRTLLLFTLFAISMFSGLLAIKLKDRKLKLDKAGMKFPNGMMPDLDWRQIRSWDDLRAVGLNNAADKENRSLQLYFNSGGKARLYLNRLSRSDQEQFFIHLDNYASQVLRSPELVAFRHELFNSQNDPSYTQLWEEELASHFAATNFVALNPGSKLQNGKLSIAMHLSSGGLSAVYLAEVKGNKMLVLKESVVPAGSSEENRLKAKEMLEREAKLLMSLEHPQIARVLDHFQENNRDYITLEYIPGLTLREYIKRNGAQSEAQVRNWAKQIAEILKYLHEHDPPIIHRDLTPDNLMLTPSGRIVLIDFGAANQFLGSATGTIVGKQFYISPEQFRGKATPASDIYSLGGTMHFLLTASDPEALSCSNPQSIKSSISTQMNSLVSKATKTKEAERIQSASELLAELAGIDSPDAQEQFEDLGHRISTKKEEKQAI
ncbi:MAG: serine/threonine protein kinase, partial [Candidatus Obscuribacterales bacterium]|nr:serine/threonine protein kinase [Candidatus Obscuribacterales bacterium]